MQDAVESRVRDRLVSSGVRFTRGRRAVLHGLSRASGPRSAAELHGDMRRRVPLSSLYRSLAVLEEAGVLVAHTGSRGVTRFELAEWLAGHHHHLVCRDCGMVSDIHLDPEKEAGLQRLAAEAADNAGFAASAHSLEIEGRCTRCR